MDDHIAKPIDIHILLDTLNKIFLRVNSFKSENFMILKLPLAYTIGGQYNIFEKTVSKSKKIKLLKADGHMKTITREKYLDRMIALRGTPDIKIITGIRRSGKSKLMQAYMEYLKKSF